MFSAAVLFCGKGSGWRNVVGGKGSQSFAHVRTSFSCKMFLDIIFIGFPLFCPFLLHLNVHMDCPGNDEVTSGDPNLVRCLGGLLLFGRFFIIPSLGLLKSYEANKTQILDNVGALPSSHRFVSWCNVPFVVLLLAFSRMVLLMVTHVFMVSEVEQPWRYHSNVAC